MDVHSRGFCFENSMHSEMGWSWTEKGERTCTYGVGAQEYLDIDGMELLSV